MERNIEALKNNEFDLLVIGGGITGAAVAHDASLRGLKVALVEMKDFGWATSSATSKLIHGGLRYLKNMEFGLVRESLRERRIYEMIAPHLVYPVPFLVPTYKYSMNSRIMIYPGMVLYDVLSYDKGHLDDPDRRIPSYQILSKQRVTALEPNVNSYELTGGAIYWDCQMYNSERLTLSFVLTAAENGAEVANYIKVQDLINEHGKITGAKVKDILTGEEFDIRAKVTANVSGPWADFISGLGIENNNRKVLRSEGIHIITRPIVKEHAIVYRTKSGRHFFIIPWRNKSLIGTTDTEYQGSPDDYCVTEEKVLDFIDEINDSHPAGNLRIEDVEFAYGGLRPIVEDETDVDVSSYDASRKYEIFDHFDSDNLQNFFTVIGGKYTTSRAVAEQLVDKVYAKLSMAPPKCVTEFTPLVGGNFKHWKEFQQRGLRKRHDVPQDALNTLMHLYGLDYNRVVDLCAAKPQLADPIGEGQKILACQVEYAVKNEMAMRLEDVVYRRTDLATIGKPHKKDLEATAEIMAEHLGWDKAKQDEEVELIWAAILTKGIRCRIQ